MTYDPNWPTANNYGAGFQPVWSYQDGGTIVVRMEKPVRRLTPAERMRQARLKRLAKNPPCYSIAEVLDLMRGGNAEVYEGQMWDSRVLDEATQ